MVDIEREDDVTPMTVFGLLLVDIIFYADIILLLKSLIVVWSAYGVQIAPKKWKRTPSVVGELGIVALCKKRRSFIYAPAERRCQLLRGWGYLQPSKKERLMTKLLRSDDTLTAKGHCLR